MAYAVQIGERLLTQGILTQESIDLALARQKELGGRIGTQLLDLGLISRFTLSNLLNQQHGYPLLRVADDIHVKNNAVAAFPNKMVQQYKIIPITNLPEVFTLGVIDPPTRQLVQEVEMLMRKPVKLTMLPEAVFHQLRRDQLRIQTDFFDKHLDPLKMPERPFQEGHAQPLPRNLILFEAAGISLAFFRQNKNSTAKRIGDMLIEDNVVTQAELEKSLARHTGMHLGEALIEDNMVDSRLLSRYLSRHYSCATIDTYVPLKVAPEILALVHPGSARKFLFAPLAIYENNLLVLTADPDNQNLLQVAGRETGYTIKPVVTPRVCVKWQIDHLYPEKKKAKV